MSWLAGAQAWTKAFEEKWYSQSDQSFWEFAYQEMPTFDWQAGFKLDQFLNEFLNSSAPLKQLNAHSTFGEPPLTLYFDSRGNFVLDLYIWERAHTAVHNHGFEGCFYVLQGSSLECLYEFQAENETSPLGWGELRPVKMNLLKQGATRPIPPHEKMIHRVLHLEKPTISLVLRNTQTPGPFSQIQFAYQKLASPSFPSGHIITKKRTYQWMLSKDLLKFNQIDEEMVLYRETWDLLMESTKGQVIATNLAMKINRLDLMNGIRADHEFRLLFDHTEDYQVKLLAAAFDFWGKKNWLKWVHKEMNLKPELAQETLRQAVEILEGKQGQLKLKTLNLI